MLLGVLSLVDLAGGVVSFTHPTGIRHSCGSQHTVTAHSLWEKHNYCSKSKLKFNITSHHGINYNRYTNIIYHL